MSEQPLTSPNRNIIRTRSASPNSGVTGPRTPAAGSKSRTSGAIRIIGMISIAHSRRRVSTRPNTNAETIPETPEAAKISPTIASP